MMRNERVSLSLPPTIMAATDYLPIVHLPVLLLFVFCCAKLFTFVMKQSSKHIKLIPTLSSSSKTTDDTKPTSSEQPLAQTQRDLKSYPQFGRRYHNYHKGIYPFPCDEVRQLSLLVRRSIISHICEQIEQERLDVYHQVYQTARDGQLFCAPIDTSNDFRVLDVGTGTGIWALEVAEYVGHCFIFFSLLTRPV